MSATRAITLPHGLLGGGRRRSSVELRLPTGEDELAVAGNRGSSRAEQVTELLSRCVVRIEDVEVDEEVVRRLTVGDREALLLHLRASLFGDRLSCVVDCPACGDAMDIDLAVSELLLPAYEEVRERHSFALPAGAAEARLVTGGDQEAAARLGGGQPGVEELLARCVLADVVPDVPTVSDVLAGLDPQAEITIAVVCPSCGEPVAALVDAAGILLAELTDGEDRLLREVDALARSYHWSETDILGLDVQRRRRYLDLLYANEEES